MVSSDLADLHVSKALVVVKLFLNSLTTPKIEKAAKEQLPGFNILLWREEAAFKKYNTWGWPLFLLAKHFKASLKIQKEKKK